jgi:hypothetical protein
LSRIGFFLTVVTFVVSSTYSFAPDPLISEGRPVYTSFSGSADNLVDGKFGTAAWTVGSNNSWIAINLETGPDKILLT